ncbi:hypothetical protein [Pseudonocardia pini]|uniref:hypothetical protein n=1 Tax=Pseudonocardia pini TaxID=2758030 RepID=UPI0015F0A3D2|nr:hypothetical protein [Pseudonocardia pini]
MAFTYVTLVRRYLLPSGAPATGKVRITPTQPMVNANTTVAAPVETVLDVEGDLTVLVAANTDPETLPADPRVAYRVVEDITGQARRSYLIEVPHDAGDEIDLSSLAELQPASPLVPVAPVVNTDGDPGRRIFVGSNAPASPTVGDVWISPV